MNSVANSSWLINDRKIATRITLIFLLLSGWWVVITLLLQPLSKTNPAEYVRDDFIKDGGYIGMAAVLLYWLIRSNLAAFRRSERALRQSEERYRTLMENLPMGVYRTTPGPTGQFLMINQAGLHIFGYDSEEALDAIHVSDVYVDPAERAKFSERLLAQGQVTGVQLQLKHKSGAPIWVSVTAQVVYDEHPQVAYFDCVLEDITARKQAEEALLETSQTLSAIFESAPLGIVVLDPEGRVQKWNPAAERIFGWKKEEVLGKLYPAAPPDQIDEFLDLHTQTMQGKAAGTLEVRRQRKDGTLVDVSRTGAPLSDAHGRPKGAMAIIADITDRKQTEALLARERDHLHALMDNIPDTIYFKDTASRFTLINQAQVRVLGVDDPSQAVGQTDADFFPAEVARGAFEEEQAIVATGQPLIDREQYNPTRDGRPRWFSDTKTPIRDKDGQVIGLVGVSRDITARKQTEEKLRVSEAELRALFNAMPDVILVLDRQGRYLQIAPSNPALLYRPSAELLGRTLHEVFAVEQADLFLEAIRRAIETRQTVNFEYSLKMDNREVWFATALSPLLEDSVLWVARNVTDRKLAEAALRESEQRYRNLFDNSPLGIYRTTPAGRILVANPALVKMLDYSSWEELAQRNLEEEGFEAGYERRQFKERLELEGVIMGLESEWLRRDLTRIYVRENAQVIRDEGGAVLYYEGTVEDITLSRRQAQIQTALYHISEAAQSASKLDDLFHSIHAIVGELIPAQNFYIALYDPAADLVSFPYYVDEYDAAPPPSKLGKGLTDHVLRTGQPLLALPSTFEQLIATGEVELVGAPSVDWLGVPLKAQSVTIGVLVVQSYTEGLRFGQEALDILEFISGQVAMAIARKRAEEALLESEERYRHLVDLSPDGIAVHQQGKIVFVNPSAVKLLRAATADHVLGRLVISFVHPDDRAVVSERFRQMLDLGRSVPPLEERFLQMDGTPFEVEVVAAPFSYHGQSAIQVVFRDITLRKRRERELTAIGQVASALRAARTHAQMLPIVLDQLQSLLKVEASALLLVDPIRHESVIELARGQWTALGHQKIAWVTGDEVAGLVQQGPIYLSRNPRSDLGLSQPDGLGDIQAVAIVPLMVGDRPLGALWVGRSLDPDDEESRLVTAVADIAANAIHRADLHEQAQRRADQLAAVNTLGRALAETLDLPQIYARARVAIEQLLPDSSTVLISSFDPGRQLITCEYAMHEGQVMDVRTLPALQLEPPGRGVQSEAIYTKRPVIANDLRERLRQVSVNVNIGDDNDGVGTQSAVSVPMLAKGNVIGVVQVQSYTLNRFSPGDAELLSLIANTAAVSIENAQLFEAERRQLRLAQTLQAVGGLLTAEMSLDQVFNYLFDLLARVVNYDTVSIQLIENDRAYLAAARGSFSLEQLRQSIESIIPSALEERWGQPHQRLMVISDTQTDRRWIAAPGSEYIRSWIGAALRIKGRLLGILNVDSKIVNAYDESVGDTVAAFANQAAIAIENAQLHEAVRRHADELERRVIERTAELERERQRIQAILDAAGEGIVFTDPEGVIEYVNPAMEKLTGYTAGEVHGQSLRLWRSSRSAHAIIDEAWRVIRRGELWLGEMVNRRKDGALYEVAITIAPLNGAAGDLIGHVGILRDITHQKEVERLKDQFVTNVSHELRTPLANVKLYLNLLERGRPEKRGEYMQTLHREAARLTNLIEDMLDISRLDLGAAPIQSMPADLNPLIDQLIVDRSALAGDRNLSIERQLDPDLPPALADPPLLTQVMSNLMTNAINYTPPGGVITISTVVRERQQRRWITFSVQDTGPGIAPQDLPHLFERFYRGEVGRKSGAPGTGLGLAICQEIMARMEGQITVESRTAPEESGATFTVWLRPADEELP